MCDVVLHHRRVHACILLLHLLDATEYVCLHASAQPEYGTELVEVLESVECTLLVLDGRCRVLNRLLSLFELWNTAHLTKESKNKRPKLEVCVCIRVCTCMCVRVHVRAYVMCRPDL